MRRLGHGYVLSCIPLLGAVLLCLAVWRSNNDPWPTGETARGTMYVAFGGVIKSLDPAFSYFEHEGSILDNIVEAPLAYHYLKRPYTLIPRLVETIPQPQYFDSKGNLLAEEDPSPEAVARVEYAFTIREGVRWQPHPCFAKNPDGSQRYVPLPKGYHVPGSPSLFPEQETREVTSEDFTLALVRLCAPSVSSPVFSTLKSFLAGFDDCSAFLTQHGQDLPTMRSAPHAGILIEDARHFRLVLTRKYPQALYWFSMHFFAPVPWEAFSFYEEPDVRAAGLTWNRWPVGTGPYLLEEFQDNAHMILRRNPNHRWDVYPSDGAPGDQEAGLLADAGAELPFIERVHLQVERESLPGWIKFNQGYYDLTGSMPSDAFDANVVISDTGAMGLSDEMLSRGISIHTSVRDVSYYYAFNQLDPVYGGNSPSAKKIRRAISIAIDSQENIELFLNNRGKIAQSILPPGVRGGEVSSTHYNHWVFEHRGDSFVRRPIETARQLLAEAGYPGGLAPDGHRLQLKYDHASAGQPGFKTQFRWLKNKLEAIGIELVDNGTDLNRQREKLTTGNWQFTRRGWVADYPDAENFLMLFYSPNGHVATKGRGPNYSNYTNPEYDALFRKLEVMRNSPERDMLIRQAVQILMEDAPCVWDFYPSSFSLCHSWLKNYKPHDIAKDTLKYRRLDEATRSRARHEWNRPPRAILCVFILVCASLFSLALAFVPKNG
ncbi:MAG: hypothetical protein IJJ26_03195 [Victivallales bacterium]|nr:hypothetical protein [Victivallales bacterium]